MLERIAADREHLAERPRGAIVLAPAAVQVHRKADGTVRMRSPQSLGPYSRCVGDWLEHWADTAPDRIVLAERDGPGWRTLSYGKARDSVRSIAGALLARGLGPHAPVAALSENGIAMGLMMLGAMHAGVPFAPISSAYALLSTDYAKLRHIFGLLEPALVFVSDANRYLPALDRAGLAATPVVAATNADDWPRALKFEALCQDAPTPRSRDAFARLTPDHVAKILFTSGSTGTPKGVINTHRMMCSNQQALAQLLPFLAERPPVLVDWLPWNHTAGCNGSMNYALRHGGTLYVDDGKPMPGAFERTLQNLRLAQPTLHTNVPRGWEMLLDALEADASLRSHFFAELDYMAFAGAAMPRIPYGRLLAMARVHRGERIVFSAGYGATETAPAVTIVHFPNDDPANVGLPLPGVELKLVPNAGKIELRVRGPNVMPGYWRQPELSTGAFDDEGFYRIGDAVTFRDPADPAGGLLFDGRVADDFKLSSATWVDVGGLRARAVTAGAPLVQDVIVTGHDRDWIGLLVVLNEPAARRFLIADAAVELRALAASPELRERIRASLRTLTDAATGSATRPMRALLLDVAPTLDTGELTDKGAISQRMVLASRSIEVERLYAEPPDGAVLLLGGT